METITLQHPKRQFKDISRFGNGTGATHKVESTAFRLSDLDVSDRLVNLDKYSNGLLLQIAMAHIPNFDSNVSISPDRISDFLVKEIASYFKIGSPTNISIGDEKLVVFGTLEHDFYLFDFSAFLSLRYRSPKLYQCFCAFIKQLEMPFIEEEETIYFFEDYFDFMVEGMSSRDAYYEKKHFEMAKSTIAEIKECEMTLGESIQILSTYRPTNELYRDIKSFLVKWTGASFLFENTAPYEFYDADEDLEELDRSIYERTEIYNRIALYCNKGKGFYNTFKQSLQDTYANGHLLQPCWTISTERAETSIRDSIYDFVRFSDDFYNLVSRLEN